MLDVLLGLTEKAVMQELLKPCHMCIILLSCSSVLIKCLNSLKQCRIKLEVMQTTHQIQDVKTSKSKHQYNQDKS